MNDGVQVIVPREVPLGGLRSMTVRRTLPARERSFVGAWCFVDHYGPDDVEVTGGMDVAPHPHCGLATDSTPAISPPNWACFPIRCRSI